MRRGVSNAAGVGLLLGVVVAVAVTTGLLSVVYYTPPPVIENPSSTIEFDYDRNLTAGDSLQIEHAGGETLFSDRVRIEITDSNDPAVNDVYYWSNFTENERVSEGDTLLLDQTTLSTSEDRLDLSEAQVRVVAQGEAERYTIGQWSGPSS